ncbi:MAG TPA: hypothetical protein VM925_14055 [Labilithrix sp.]|nr:hypothetical protein [Labilithrix sp.]
MSSPQARPTRTLRIPIATDVFVRRTHASACPLGPIETQVFAQIDGTASLGDIAAALRITVREVAMIVSRLTDLGATELRGDELDAAWGDVPAAETVPPRRGP